MTCKNWEIQGNSNNSMSSFGLIEENMELSHIHLSVSRAINFFVGVWDLGSGEVNRIKFYENLEIQVKIIY